MIVSVADFASLTNGTSLPLSKIPTLPLEYFTNALTAGIAAGLRISSYFGMAGGPDAAGAAAGGASSDSGATTLYALLADDEQNRLLAARAKVEGDSFPSIAVACPQAQLFEREIAEQYGLIPAGHPWFKPVRYQRSWTGRDAWGRKADEPILPAVGDFYRVEGEQVHEVAVGPVHAGVIEPGHFRFQCHGEQVFHLEIALGYQHRGIERSLIGGPDKRSLHYAETMAGDSTIAHATSYCQILESLSGCRAPARAQALLGIALELERLANHVGDLGALAGDVAYLPTANFCGRIRGDFLNMSALFCGNRFGRGFVAPGGILFDCDAARIDELKLRLDAAETDTSIAVNLLWDTQSVLARFEDTGMIDMATATELGLVGPAARASGLSRDSRRDQPAGIWRFAQVPVSTCETGDVFARAYVRWMEIKQSIQFIRDRMKDLPGGEIRARPENLAADSLSVSLNEGWRGEACHVAITDAGGRFARYKVVDPSFHNWPALARSLRDQEISDFPICNKSFNLSYCGHDL